MMQELSQVLAAKGNHKRRIKEIEEMKEVKLSVRKEEATTTLRLDRTVNERVSIGGTALVLVSAALLVAGGGRKLG